MTTEELLELNKEIEDLEATYVESKLEYETKKADILLNTDFSSEIGKPKPTVAEKDAWVKLQTVEDERRVKDLGVIIGSRKRIYEILLKVGDD